jgi:hypothetical protein
MPAIDELAKRAGVGGSTIRPILASLKLRDLVILDADGERLVGAYPWTDRATEHRVSLGERSLNAWCAIDALGAGDMYRRDVEISSRCRFCGAPVTVATRDRGRAVTDVQPGSAVVWSGVRHTDGCAANTMCTVVAFFCDDAHLEAWRAEHHPEGPGFRLSTGIPARRDPSPPRSPPPHRWSAGSPAALRPAHHRPGRHHRAG